MTKSRFGKLPSSAAAMPRRTMTRAAGPSSEIEVYSIASGSTAPGGRPACRAPASTWPSPHRTAAGEAMLATITPSATRPPSSSSRGPRATTTIGIAARVANSSAPRPNRISSPRYSTSPPARSRRISSIASRMAVTGFVRSIPIWAKPEPPAPSPRTARPPDSSSRLAIATAVRAGWRT